MICPLPHVSHDNLLGFFIAKYNHTRLGAPDPILRISVARVSPLMSFFFFFSDFLPGITPPFREIASPIHGFGNRGVSMCGVFEGCRVSFDGAGTPIICSLLLCDTFPPCGPPMPTSANKF